MPTLARCPNARSCGYLFLLLGTLYARTGQAQPPAGLQLAGTPSQKASERPTERGARNSRRLHPSHWRIAARVSQGVVQILVTGYGPVEDSGRTDTALIARQRALGSEVIVDPAGYIMANAHVIEGAQRPALPVDATRRVRQGQLVFAIGSPEGLQHTVTLGIVSSVARQADPNKAMVYIQTDAPINPGNSGGPLVDMNGYVVGINTFIVTGSRGSEGLGFAPARVVHFVYESLRKYGHVHRSEIEAGAQTITSSLAAGLDLRLPGEVLISDVTPEGPSEAAGLKVADIVLATDDRPDRHAARIYGSVVLTSHRQGVEAGCSARGRRRRRCSFPSCRRSTRWINCWTWRTRGTI